MKSVIFDTDIGIDDAMALLFLHYAPEIELIAITTKFGNASVENTTRNALIVKQLFGIDAPVFKGAAAPLSPPLSQGFPAHVHGKDGLGDVISFQTTLSAEAKSAAQALVDLTAAAQDKISIIAVGGLTNIAAAIQLDPSFGQRVDKLIVMGGAFGYNGHRGNVSPVAEANIASDPLAADRVFSAAMATTIVGLDVTHEVVMDHEFIQSLVRVAPHAGNFIAQTNQLYFDFHHSLSGKFECPLHDSSAVAYLLKPELFSTIEHPVRVVTQGIALGQTIHGDGVRAYVSDAWDNLPQCTICTSVDGAGVLDLYKSTLALAPNT
ncbi:MAG: purine nucleosidase [Pseudohongiellaceae bacterium]|jgi:purine nucleosidase